LTRTGFEELDAGVVSADANDSWSSGTPRQTASFVDDPRIPLSSGLLVELLSGVYYAMFVTFCFIVSCHYSRNPCEFSSVLTYHRNDT